MIDYLLTGVALTIAVLLLDCALQTGVMKRSSFWMTLVVLLIITAVFDNYLVMNIVRYDAHALTGLVVGVAPIEDFLYGAALFSFVIIVWEFLKKPGRTTLKELFLSARPFSWINTAAVVIVAAWLTGKGVTIETILTALYFTLPYNLLLYGINDVYDYPSDAKNPRKNSIEGGLLPPRAHRALWFVAALLNLPFLIFIMATGSTTAKMAYLALMATTLAYSVPPLRLKEIPILDAVISATHFVGPFIVSLAFFGAEHYPLLDIMAFFCWCMASQMLGAIQDITVDRQVGMKSCATALGAAGTGIITWFLYAACVFLVIAQGGPLRLIAAALLLLYVVNASMFLANPSEAAGRPRWRTWMYLNYVVGFGLSILLILAGIGAA